MKIFADSLAKTVDSVEEDYFFSVKTSRQGREEVAQWIAGRLGGHGSYADMFAPTAADLKNGIKLFTGESIAPSASLRHVSGEQACRALILLKSKSNTVQAALKSATNGMMAALDRCRGNGRDMFCCGTCDPALWRHITAGGLYGAEEWLAKGMRVLKAHREGNSQWARFPFYFTLLALTEIDLKAAVLEMKYAEPRCEQYLSRKAATGSTSLRRRAVVERVLARC